MINFIFEKNLFLQQHPIAELVHINKATFRYLANCRISTYKQSNFQIFRKAGSTTPSPKKSNAVTGSKLLLFISNISLSMNLIACVGLYPWAFAHISHIKTFQL